MRYNSWTNKVFENANLKLGDTGSHHKCFVLLTH